MPARSGLGPVTLALLAIASGVASAALVLPPAFGVLPRLLFLGLAPLPLFACGLSSGALSCVVAGLAGAVIVVLRLGAVDGAIYLAAAAAPAAMLVREALRPASRGDGGKVWRSGSGLLLWLTGVGLVGVIALIGYFAVFEHGVAALIAQQSGLGPQQAAMAARIAPGLGAALGMALLAVDGVLAERLLLAAGWALRPPVAISTLSLPLWVGPILMVAGLAGAALREGTIGMICLNSAIVLIVPFAVLGLALMHALLGRRRNGRMLVMAAYVVLLATPALLGWRAALLVTLALAGFGSADQLMDFRGLRGLRSGIGRK